MDIGRTNNRITFCSNTEKQNELLQTETVLEEIKTVWASVEPTRGREYQEAQRLRPELTYKITTRYHKEVTPDMFIKFKDRYYQIVSIINVRESNEMLKNIKGYETREAYVSPYDSLTEDRKVASDSSNIKEQVRRDKLVSSLREAIEKCEIKDGMTISFHHHFRAGDKLLMQVVDILAEMGLKNLRIAASSLTSAHNGLVAHIENGEVNRIETSGL